MEGSLLNYASCNKEIWTTLLYLYTHFPTYELQKLTTSLLERDKVAEWLRRWTAINTCATLLYNLFVFSEASDLSAVFTEQFVIIWRTF